jgi:hypothetical protein
MVKAVQLLYTIENEQPEFFFRTKVCTEEKL